MQHFMLCFEAECFPLYYAVTIAESMTLLHLCEKKRGEGDFAKNLSVGCYTEIFMISYQETIGFVMKTSV